MKHFTTLESLRAYLAIYVMLTHGLWLTGIHDSKNEFARMLWNALPDNQDAVSVFIILSGFVISHLLWAEGTTYKQYIVGRFFRIFPAYYFCLFLAVATYPLYSLVFTSLAWLGGQDALPASVETSFWTHLLLHMSLMHGAIPDEVLVGSSVALLSPAWSVSLEWQFYMVAPILIILLGKRSGSVTLLSALTLSVVYFAFLTGQLGSWPVRSALPLALPYFVLGILSYQAQRSTADGRGTAEIFVCFALFLALVDPLPAAIWTVAMVVLLSESGRLSIQSQSYNAALELLVFNPIVRSLGRWSYSIYLLHMPIYSLIIGLYIRQFGVGELGKVTLILLVGVGTLATIGGSWLLYRFIEAPFIEFGRSIRVRDRAA